MQQLSDEVWNLNLLCHRQNHISTHTTIEVGSHARLYTHRTMFGIALKSNASSQLMSDTGREFLV